MGGADEVLMILYDDPNADFYPIVSFPCVFGLRITLTGEGRRLHFYRCTQYYDDGEHSAQLLMFLRFLLAKERALGSGNLGHGGTWLKK